MSKDDIRAAVLDAKPKSKVITLFGQEVEIKQSSVSTILNSYETVDEDGKPDKSQAYAKLIVAHCFVPGTNEPVFSEEDIDIIKALPFGKELNDLQSAINDLMGIEVKAELKNSGKTRSSLT